MKRSIIIWGAGKIGRGFLAEAFRAGGYDVVLVDAAQSLIAALNKAGRYTLIKAVTGEEPEIVEITGFRALLASDSEGILAEVREAPFVGVAVFPGVFDALADSLAAAIKLRSAGNDPLDIIVCANARGASDDLRDRISARLDEPARRWMGEYVGFVETVIMRIGVITPAHFEKYGDLAVVTNGFPYMPIHGPAFKNPIPDIPIIKPIDDIHAEEERKFFTYNMAHAVFAYAGRMRGHATVLDAAADPIVSAEVEAALEEAGTALVREYGFDPEEMAGWNRTVVANLTNPLLEDTLERLGADPIRKLGPRDRLVGPARLCKLHGVLPWYITRTIARAFLFDLASDEASQRLQAMLRENGVADTIRRIGELDKDPEIVSFVSDHFKRLLADPLGTEDTVRVAALRTAYESGFRYEKVYHGCAQCALASMFDVEKSTDKPLFQAASAFAGGVGLTGDGICGGYAAGVLWMGSHVGRRFDNFDGDKEAQYKSFEMTQRLRDRFLETYGSITCRHIHEKILDRAYILKTKPVRNDFEAAGGHADRCTSVVAMSALWTSEILMDEGYLPATAAEKPANSVE